MNRLSILAGVLVLAFILPGCDSFIPDHERPTSERSKRMTGHENTKFIMKRKMHNRKRKAEDLIMFKRRKRAEMLARREKQNVVIPEDIDRDKYPFVGTWRPASAGDDQLIFKKDGSLEFYSALDLKKVAETGTYKVKGFDQVEIMIKGVLETYELKRTGGMVYLPKLGTFSPPPDIDFNRRYTEPDKIASFCVVAGSRDLYKLYGYLSENAKDNLLSTGIRDGRELMIHHKFTSSLARRLYNHFKVESFKLIKEKKKFRTYRFKLKSLKDGKTMSQKVTLVKEKDKWRCNRFAYGFLKYISTGHRGDPPIWFKNLSQNKTKMPMISNYSGDPISVRGSYLKFKGQYTVLIHMASRIMGAANEIEGALIPRYSTADKVFFEFSGRAQDKVTKRKIIKFYTKGYRDYFFKLMGKTYGFRDVKGNARKEYKEPLPREKYSEKKMMRRLRGFQGFLKKSAREIKAEGPEADRIIREGRAKGLIR